MSLKTLLALEPHYLAAVVERHYTGRPVPVLPDDGFDLPHLAWIVLRVLVMQQNNLVAVLFDLARVAKLVRAKVNCIPYNTVEGLEWKRPDEARQDAFMAVLDRARIPATIRREKGHDIAAACGQLRRQQNVTAA